MTPQIMDKLLEMGVRLSAEKDYSRLLESVLSDAMSLTHCDAGVLYLREDDALVFKIMRNDTNKSYQGGDGEKISFSPILLIDKNICAVALTEDRIICINDVDACAEYDFLSAAHYELMPGYQTKSMMVVPLKNREGDRIGVLQLINAVDEEGKRTVFTEDDTHMIKSVASQAAVAIRNMLYVEEIKKLFHSLVQVLSTAIDERTPYNATHTRNMVSCGERFVDYLNEKCAEAGEPELFSPMHKDEFLMSVWLHDIGKLVTPLEVMNKSSRLKPEELTEIKHRFQIMRCQCRIAFLEGRLDAAAEKPELQRVDEAERLVEQVNLVGALPDEVLETIYQIGTRSYVDVDGAEKPWLTDNEMEKLSIRKGTLTDAERFVMENHASITAKLLAEIKFSEDYSNVPFWASSHHEFLNGSGYPRHLQEQDIPMEVRILTILDIFDALTADDRPYKPGMPVKEALSILKDMAGVDGKLDITLTEQFAESCCWEQ